MSLNLNEEEVFMPEGNPTLILVFQLLIFGAIFYFLLIRPQRKKDKAFREMLGTLEVGDQVTTLGGLYGKISKIKDDKIVIESGTTEKTKLYIYKWGIKDVQKKEQA